MMSRIFGLDIKWLKDKLKERLDMSTENREGYELVRFNILDDQKVQVNVRQLCYLLREPELRDLLSALLDVEHRVAKMIGEGIGKNERSLDGTKWLRPDRDL